MSPSRGIGELTDKFTQIYKGYENRGRQRSQEVKNSNKKEKDTTSVEPPSVNPSNPTTSPTTPTPVTTTPQTPSTQPADTVQSKVDSDLFSLAGRYVENYEKQAGKTLSAEQKKALVQDVYTFYSEPSRTGRLAAVVNA